MNSKSIFLAFSILFFSNLHYSQIYVDLDATGSKDGSNWQNAYTDLQDAISAAENGDLIYVAEGNYAPTQGTIQSARFFIDKSISIYGGFEGNETLVIERDFNEHPTRLTGAIGNPEITDNTNTLIEISGVSNLVRIDGFFLQSALAVAEPNILIEDSDNVIFVGCRMRNCISQFVHQIEITNSNMQFVNCLFRNIDSESSMIHTSADSQLDIVGCTITECISERFVDGSGGNVEVYNSIVWNNEFDLDPLDLDEAAYCIFQSGESGITSPLNILDIDPIFQNPEILNFNLSLESPARNSGRSGYTNPFNTDLSFNERIVGSQVDMGCFEHVIPNVIYVDQNASGLNDGSSWTDAYTDFESAILGVSEGDQIWVAQGTYQSPSWSFLKIVEIYGGFLGNETELDQRDYANNSTFFYAEGGVLTGIEDNPNNVLGLLDTDPVVYWRKNIIDGITIGLSYQDVSDPYNLPAPLIVMHSSEIRNCIFRDNINVFNGAIRMGNNSTSDQDLLVENCIFVNNQPRLCVIKIEGNDNNIDIVNSTFANNLAWENDTIFDSVIFDFNNNLNFYNNIVWNNECTYDLKEPDNIESSVLEHSAFLSTPQSQNIVYSDPLFADPAGNNFTLTEASPAIGLANPVYMTLEYDLLGNPRQQQSGMDAGCYESPYEAIG